MPTNLDGQQSLLDEQHDVKPKRGRGRPRKDETAPGPPKAKTTDRKPGRPSTNVKQREQLTALFATIGTGVYALNPADGVAILSGSENLAGALVKVAEKNPQVARVLDALLKTSTYGELLVAVAAIAVPICANHGILPAGVSDLLTVGANDGDDTTDNGDQAPKNDDKAAA